MTSANTRKLRIAILLSGSGRTLLNLQKRIEEGTLSATIERVVSSRADVLGVERARDLGIPTEVVDRKTCSPADFDARITNAVAGVAKVDWLGKERAGA